jgi:arylsulfatase A-like enzyme
VSPERPNLVLFMPDQLRADALGCFGNPAARTPHIDALAARGTRFANAFVNHPVCGPSRVSLMTGWYPHVRGHRTLTHLLKPWEPNLLRLLKEAGYAVLWAGARGDTFAPGVTEQSTHFCGFTVRPSYGMHAPRYPEGSKLFDAFYNGRREHDGVCLDFDEATVRTAEDVLGDAPREPWVLFVALVFPHLPFEVEEPWCFTIRARCLRAFDPTRPGASRASTRRSVTDTAPTGSPSATGPRSPGPTTG